MALAHTRGFSNKRKIQFLIDCVHDKMSLQESLEEIKKNDRLGFNFTDKEWEGIRKSVDDLPNYSFLAEKIEDQGIHSMNIMDSYVYPRSLKKNLGKDSPIIIYGKGNMDLLKLNRVAIVGSRKSSQKSLEFTENVSKEAVKNKKVIVSGFAKGVDRQALDSALKYKGQSIVVLPQGIETYKSKTYYQDIVKGNVLVLSVYHPKAPWSVGLAMDRNKIIYGLAEKIYAAESANKGGTWEGVLNGLKRGRRIYVRQPESNEKNANLLLIQKGATGVDMFGNPISTNTIDRVQEKIETYHKEHFKVMSNEELINKVIELIKMNNGNGITTSEIKDKLSLEDAISKKISRILNKSELIIKRKKGRQNLYSLKESIPTQGDLFK